MLLNFKKILLNIIENFSLSVLIILTYNILLVFFIRSPIWQLIVSFLVLCVSYVIAYGALTKKYNRTPVMAILGLVFDKKITKIGVARYLLISRFLMVISFLATFAIIITYSQWKHFMAVWIFCFSIGVMYNLYFFWWVYKLAFYKENILAASIGANIIQNRRKREDSK